MKHLASLILIGSMVCYGLGLWYPILGTKVQTLGFVWSYEDVRLFDSVKYFFDAGELMLAGIIFFFTIVFPIVKYVELTNRAISVVNVSERVSAFMGKLDKWSMLDVYLVALLLMNYKMDSPLVVMKLKMGTTFIGLSVVLRMVYCSIQDKVDIAKVQLH
ncbi:MAG: paraquat-inducible protein A [Flavobacteriales bacterium]|nr:paraquat-inducible protein A [Flavobacteriales bacterium]